ncbi:MAG: sigma-54-dependent Fis family transcriptional regulator [Deltaproteobacteria bacterium]|nr:sigma-54-dependent Fis family transcriptional regulator [Deltaproteobacteria bacterium]
MKPTPSAASPVPPQRILVIDDDPVVCLSCARILVPDGHHVETCQNPREGLKLALQGGFDILLLDLVMPDLPGIDVLAMLHEAGVETQVMIITGYSTVQTAVEAMRLGAADYLSKPFIPDELRMALRKLIERSFLLRENAELRRILQNTHSFEEIVGQSRPMERVFSLIRRVAPTQSTVLITGESGTGKDLVARAIHRQSGRKDRPFLACDCSALVPTLLESELFGHVRGSFSGAIATKLGLFQAANGGTLFLDEVSNISLEIQGKLLRTLETRRIKKVGDTEELDVDIRLVAATNRDLRVLVRDGAFREDLFYRLNVFPIDMPPVRERKDDVPLLLQFFLDRFRAANTVKAVGFTPEALLALESYSWPGNVRELKNMVERMAILCDSERIDTPQLPAEARPATAAPTSSLPTTWEDFKHLKRQVSEATAQEMERRFLTEVLARCGGNVTRAAEDIGIQRTNLHFLLRKHGLRTRDLA